MISSSLFPNYSNKLFLRLGEGGDDFPNLKYSLEKNHATVSLVASIAPMNEMTEYTDKAMI